jgi:hypothetical protein
VHFARSLFGCERYVTVFDFIFGRVPFWEWKVAGAELDAGERAAILVWGEGVSAQHRGRLWLEAGGSRALRIE